MTAARDRHGHAGLARSLGLAATMLLLASTAGAQGVAVDQANDEQKQQASETFREARSAYDDKRFADALRNFRASYDIVASPNARLMVGYSLRDLGRNAEAYDELGAVAKEADAAAAQDSKYEQTARLAREARDELRSKITVVTILLPETTPDATLSIGGRDIPPDRWGSPIAVDSGQHVVALTSGGEATTQDLEAVAGQSATIDLAVSAGGDEEGDDGGGSGIQWTGTQQYIAYGVAGLGVVSLAAAAGLGGAAQSTYGDLETACGDAPCPASRQGDIDQGRTLRDASNATLIIGLLAVGAGATLFFTAPTEDGDDADTATWVQVGPGSLSLHGRF